MKILYLFKNTHCVRETRENLDSFEYEIDLFPISKIYHTIKSNFESGAISKTEDFLISLSEGGTYILCNNKILEKSIKNVKLEKEKSKNNIIRFADNSEFDLAKLGFTKEELSILVRGLDWTSTAKSELLRDKLYALIYGLQDLESSKVINESYLK